MDATNTRRTVILGKTGVGKSSLGNLLSGENVFKINSSPNSQTSICQAETRSVDGRSITVIDTPGFFDTVKPEEQLKPEIVKCIVECAPGPHAFLIVLKVEKFTDQENDVITKICQHFSPEVFRYAAVLFTHGDNLDEGKTIQDFVGESKRLSDLVEKCGGRCHVIDNKYWKNNQQDNYRSNQFQVAELLRTLDKIVEQNNGGCYTNEMLQEVQRKIQQEEESIRRLSGKISQEEARAKAKSIWEKRLIKFAGVTTGALVGAFFGGVLLVGLAVTALRNISHLGAGVKFVRAAVGAAGAAGTTAAEAGTAGVAAGGAATGAGTAGGAAGTAGGAAAGGAAGTAAGTAGIVLGVTAAVITVTGAAIGGVIGYGAAEEADTAGEAAEKAAKAVWKKAKGSLNEVKVVWDEVWGNDKKDQ